MNRWNALAEAASVDGSYAERLCLVLGHSLWQFGLLTVVVWLVESVGRRLSSAVRYNLYLSLLLLGVTAVPITLAVVLQAGAETARATVVRASQPAAASLVTAADNTATTIAPTELAGKLPVSEIPVVTTSPVTRVVPATSSKGLLRFASRAVVLLYGLGVCLMLARLVRGVRKSQRLMREAQPIVKESLLLSLSEIARGWNMRYLPKIAAASEVAVPCVMGLVRPTIVFPLAALNSLSPRELEMILAHELAHVRRRDLWAHLLQRLAESVLFFNPGVWYVSSRISLLREFCCDELACEREPAEATGARLRYADALLRLVECRFAQSKLAAAEQLASLAAVGGSPSHLRRRIAMLLGEPLREPLRVSRTGLVTLVLLALVLFVAPAVVVSSVDKEPKGAQATDADPAGGPDALAGKPFFERLPSGVEVKLLAIGTRGEPTQSYWLPNGSVLAGEPFQVKDFQRYNFFGPLKREVVFTMEGLPQGAEWKFRTRPSVGTSGDGGVADAEGNRLRYHHAHIASLPAEAQTFDLEVGVAIGDWKTVATCEVEGGTIVSQPENGVVFSGPFNSGPASTILTIAHELDGQTQLVMIDESGYRNTFGESRRASAGGKLSVSYFNVHERAFGESLDRIEFQVRPYEWATFNDLPVYPSPESTDAEKTEQPAVKVLAIGYGDSVEKPAPRWWDADGLPREAPPSKFSGQRNPQMLRSPRARQVVFELPRYRPGTPVRYEIKSKSGSSRGELRASELKNTGNQPLILHELHTIAPDDETFTLRVQLANGDWKTVYSGDTSAQAQGTKDPQGYKGVVFSGAFEQNGGTAVVVSHNYQGEAARLVAIPKQGGKRTASGFSHLAAADTVNQTIYEFKDLKPAEIASFDFQIQDVEWTTIENLPANPKPPADAKATISGRIILEDGSPATHEGELQYRYVGRDGKVMGTVGSFKDQYKFEVSAGTVWLAYFADGFAPAIVGPIELKPGQQLTDFYLVLKPGTEKKLKIEDEQGDAVPAMVVAIPYLGDSSSGPSVTHPADSQGNLTLDHLAEATPYRLSIHAAGYQPTIRTLSAAEITFVTFPDNPLKITLRKARPATGVVSLADGQPAIGAVLKMRVATTLQGPNNRSSIMKPPPKEVPVEADGSFSIDQLMDGAYYLVMAEAADGARVVLPPIVAGQTGIKAQIPPRRDLKIRLIGDLDQLPQRKGKPFVGVRQQYMFRPTAEINWSDLIGDDVFVEATDDGGVAEYRGLIDEPVSIIVGRETYRFDQSEGEVTIKLDTPPNAANGD